MVKDAVYLSVVVPSYNEMVNLQKGVLDKVEHFLSRKKFSFEVIVVDDGSSDGSREFVEQFAKENQNFRLIKNNHTGKEGAVTSGVLAAGGNYVLFTDMDQATPIEEVDKLLVHLEGNYDVAIGSRNTVRKGSPLIRTIISRSAIILRKLLIGMHEISDTQCGFKGFRKDAAGKLFTKIQELHHGFNTISGSAVTAGFDMELLLLAKKMGYKIKEVPVNWLYVETRRVNPITDSIDGLIDLLKIKINELRGTYN